MTGRVARRRQFASVALASVLIGPSLVAAGVTTAQAATPPAEYTLTDLGSYGAQTAYGIDPTGRDVVGALSNGDGFRLDTSTGSLATYGPGQLTRVTSTGATAGLTHTAPGGSSWGIKDGVLPVTGSTPRPGLVPPAYGATSYPALWTPDSGWTNLYDLGCRTDGAIAGMAFDERGAKVAIRPDVVGQLVLSAGGTTRGVGFRCAWDGTGYATQILGAPGAGDSAAYAMTDDGMVVGKSDELGSAIRAAVWTGTQTVPQLLPATPDGHSRPAPAVDQSDAFAVNSHHQVVGAYGSTASSPSLTAGVTDDRAFLWDATNGMQDLTDLTQAPGWVLNEAFGIADNGIIVGEGTLNGHQHAFLLHPTSTFDLVPRALTVIQAVQNDENTDDLLTGKDTFAILRLDAVGSGLASGVTATLKGHSSVLGDVGPINILGGPIDLTASTTRSIDPRDYWHELPFQVPPSWVNAGGTLTLTATVNPDYTVAEQNPHNDTISTSTLTLRPAPHLDVRFVDMGFPGDEPDHAALGTHLNKAIADIDRELPISLTDSKFTYYGNPIMLTKNPVDEVGADGACGRALAWLQQARTTWQVPAGTMLVGTMQDPAEIGATHTADPLGPRIGGCSYVPDGVAVVLSSFPTSTYVHEMSHAIGRNHVEFCGAEGADVPPYPNLSAGDAAVAHGSLHETDYLHHPDLAWMGSLSGFGSASTQDIMTYCFDKGLSVSDYTFESLERLLPTYGTVPPSSLSRDVKNGVKAYAVTASVDPARQQASLSASTTTPEQDTAQPQGGDYRVQLVDAAGSLLASYQVPAVDNGAHSDGAGAEPLQQEVSTLVPAASGTATIELWSNLTHDKLASVAVTPHAPEVSITAPAAGTTLPLSGTVAVGWSGSDADSDPLIYTVLYRPDTTSPWQPVANNLSGTTTDIDAATLPGSHASEGQLRVVASDGVNTGTADITGLTVPAKAPTATVTSPAASTSLTAGDTADLQGTVTDPQDGGLTGSALTWTDSDGHVIGTGSSVPTPPLTAGDHTFTLTGTDTAGRAGTDTVTLHVSGTGHRLVTDTHTLLLFSHDGQQPSPQSLSVDDTGTGPGTPWQASTSDPRIVLDSTSGTTPATVHVTVDTSGLAPGAVVSGTVRVTSPDAPGQVQVVDVAAQGDSGLATTNGELRTFGAAQQGNTSAPQTVTLTAHEGSLTLGTVSLDGADPHDYVLSHDGCSNVTVPTGSSCSVDVSFAPTTAGARTAELELPDGDSPDGWHVLLSGTGTGAAATATGQLTAWGADEYGQAGQTPVSEVIPCYQCVAVPTPVPGIDHVSDVSASLIDTVALTREGAVWVWGSNADGEFGNGTRDTSSYVHPTPKQVAGIPAMTAVAAGYTYTLALAGDETVWQWGLSSDIGYRCAPPWDRTLPGQVCWNTQPVDHAIAIAAGVNVVNGGEEAYALRDDGTVWWWGRADAASYPHQATPHLVTGPSGTGVLSGIIAIAHGLALRSDGTVWSFGAGAAGQLGNGTTQDWSDTAVEVLNPAGTGPLTGVTAIASRNNERYALLADGTAVAWGNGDQVSRTSVDAGIELGIGGSHPAGVSLPAPVVGPDGTGALDHLTMVAAGLAVRSDGTAWAWGDGVLGGLGDGTGFYNPWTQYGTPGPGRTNPQPVHGIGDTGTLGDVTRITSDGTKLAIIGSADSTGGSGGATSTLTTSAVDASATAGTPAELLLGHATSTDATLNPAAVTASTDWGDGTPATTTVVTGAVGGPYTVQGGHTYAAPGTYTAVTHLLDATGADAAMTSHLTVTAGALTSSGPDNALAGTEGTPVTAALGTFSDGDQSETPEALTATIDWGDGTAPDVGSLTGPPGGPFTVTGSHTYTDPGTVHGTVTLASHDGGRGTASFTVDVRDAALHALAATATLTPAASTVDGTLGMFGDDDPTATATELTAHIDWGDGTTSAGTVTGPTGGPFNVAGTHTFNTPPTPIAVTLVDAGGAQASLSVGLVLPQPQLALTSSAAPVRGVVPLNVSWTYTLTNTGAAAAAAVAVTGSACGRATYASGDTGADGLLAPGETWTLRCEATIDAPGTVTDNAEATSLGTADAQGYGATAAPTTVTAVAGEPPSAPTGVTAAPGNGLLVISFTPPPAGALPVDGYTVMCTPTTAGSTAPGAGAVTATGTASPITVTGLTNGTAYTCTVTAHNGAGDGPASQPSAATAPVAPWPWKGFLTPLSNPPSTSTVNAGSSVPVKFSVGGDRGTAIFTVGSPSSQPADCKTWQPKGTSSATSTSGHSTLTYDPKTGTYTYVWQTAAGWAGSCRILTVALKDATTHTARVVLR